MLLLVTLIHFRFIFDTHYFKLVTRENTFVLYSLFRRVYVIGLDVGQYHFHGFSLVHLVFCKCCFEYHYSLF